SYAWLFARLSTVKPACWSQCAYAGGVWKAKQFVDPLPHFDPPPVDSVPSRFPRTTSPARSVWTSEKNERPPSDGRFGVEPITMSPVATIATTPSGTFGPAVDEQREDERARGDDRPGTNDQGDHPHGKGLPAAQDEQPVGELRERGQ